MATKDELLRFIASQEYRLRHGDKFVVSKYRDHNLKFRIQIQLEGTHQIPSLHVYVELRPDLHGAICFAPAIHHLLGKYYEHETVVLRNEIQDVINEGVEGDTERYRGSSNIKKRN